MLSHGEELALLLFSVPCGWLGGGVARFSKWAGGGPGGWVSKWAGGGPGGWRMIGVAVST